MNNKHFDMACRNVQKLLYKNKYYSLDDFEIAKSKASEIINKINDNIYIPLLKQGNKKLLKNVLIFDMPSIITCKGACSNCYALKAERIYKNTRVNRLYNMLLVEYATLNKFFNKNLLKNIKKQLDMHVIMYKLPIVRFHSSGDIYSDKYLNFLLQVVENNKKIKFYTYSKTLNNCMINNINKKYKNFNIIKSLINDKYINYGNEEYIKKITDKLKQNNKKFFICDYANKKAQTHATCMGSCHACLSNDIVLFNQH